MLLLAAVVVLAIVLWRALGRHDDAPEPRDRGVLAVDLRDRHTGDD